jgi:hypothetical protein
MEPVYLEPQGAAKLTDYGKRFMGARLEQIDKHWPVIHDLAKLMVAEHEKWPAMQAALIIEGIPTAISSGLSGFSMLKLIDHNNGKTSFTMPAAVAMSMSTGAAPTVSTTGANGDNAGQYTGYTRLTLTTTNWVAASGTNPAQGTYSSAGAVTFPACSASTATETGFILADSATLNSGNALWYGTLASVVISTTQTPPTLATNALVVSLNGT